MNENMNYNTSDDAGNENCYNQNPKNQNKIKKIVILGIIGFLLVAAIVAICIVLSRPKTVIYLSVADAGQDLLSRPEIEPLVEVLESGSLEFSAKSGPQKAKGKLYFNLEEYQVYAENLSLVHTGNEYAADAYFGADGIWVEGSKGFLNGVFGLDIGNSAQDLEEYCKENGFKKDEFYYAIFSLLKSYDQGELTGIFEDINKINQETTKKKFEIALEYGVLENENRETYIDGEKVKTRVFRLILDEDALEKIDRAYYNYLEEDKEVRELLNKYEYFFVGLMGEDPDRKDIDDLFDDYIKEMRDEIDYKGESYTIKLVTKAHSFTALEFSVEYSYESKDYDYDIVMFSVKSNKKGIGKSDWLEIVYFETEIAYTIKEDSDNDFIAEVEIDDEIEGVFKYDKKAQTYNCRVTDTTYDYDIFFVKGGLVVEKDTIIIGAEEIVLYDETLDITGEIVLRTKDEMPSAQMYVNSVFKLKETEIDKLIDNLEGELEFFLDHNNLW